METQHLSSIPVDKELQKALIYASMADRIFQKWYDYREKLDDSFWGCFEETAGNISDSFGDVISELSYLIGQKMPIDLRDILDKEEI